MTSFRFRRHIVTMVGVVSIGGVVATGAAAGQSTAGRIAEPTPRPEGPIQNHGAVRYVAPAGWTVQSGGNGITLLTGPVKREDRPCEIRMLPPVPVTGDLATEGAAFVQGIATANRLGPYVGEFGRDVKLSREEGVSGTGWTYTDLSGQLGNSGITVRVLMAQMGNQVLTILGYTKTWECLGNQSMRDNDVWALLFHSLQLPGYTQESPQLAQQLIGTWSSASGHAGNSVTFAPNARFGTVALYQSYTASSTPGMVLEVDRSWQGDGPYTVHGDHFTPKTRTAAIQRRMSRAFSASFGRQVPTSLAASRPPFGWWSVRGTAARHGDSAQAATMSRT